MIERPILFSAPMVRAILDGQKTQTRRVVKPMPKWAGAFPILDLTVMAPGHGVWWWNGKHDRVGVAQECPYGRPGDRLWVREAHYLTDDGESEYAVYAADEASAAKHLRECADMAKRHPVGDGWLKRHTKLRPSIHMPRWASRILLEIVSVRVERLNDCSEADALAEGASPCANGWWFDSKPALAGSDARGAYFCLWEHINGAGSWAANPWVWVVEFKRVQP